MIDVDAALTTKNNEAKKKDINKLNAEISILNVKQMEIRRLKTEVYTDLKQEMLSNEEYNDIISNYNNQISIIDNKIRKKNAQIDSVNNSCHLDAEAFIRFNKYKGITKLTRSMVCDLVENIMVDADRNVIINFKLADDIKEYLAYSYD